MSKLNEPITVEQAKFLYQTIEAAVNQINRENSLSGRVNGDMVKERRRIFGGHGRRVKGKG